jgi:hypothetical protein
MAVRGTEPDSGKNGLCRSLHKIVLVDTFVHPGASSEIVQMFALPALDLILTTAQFVQTSAQYAMSARQQPTRLPTRADTGRQGC